MIMPVLLFFCQNIPGSSQNGSDHLKSMPECTSFGMDQKNQLILSISNTEL